MNIKSMVYDPKDRTLGVSLQGGEVRRFRGVTPEEHKSLLGAPDLDKHLEAHIVNRTQTAPASSR